MFYQDFSQKTNIKQCTMVMLKKNVVLFILFFLKKVYIFQTSSNNALEKHFSLQFLPQVFGDNVPTILQIEQYICSNCSSSVGLNGEHHWMAVCCRLGHKLWPPKQMKMLWSELFYCSFVVSFGVLHFLSHISIQNLIQNLSQLYWSRWCAQTRNLTSVSSIWSIQNNF